MSSLTTTIWYIIGILFLIMVFFVDDSKKDTTLIMAIIYCISAAIYSKLLDIEKKIK